MTPFLILQLRPETDAADGEYASILRSGGLSAAQTRRIRLDRDPLPGDLDLDAYSGVIIGGGPGCVSDPPDKKSDVEARIEAAALSLMPEITARDIPYLGCCYGIGILAEHLGAKVSKERYSEPVGASLCALTDAGRADPLTRDLPDSFAAFVGHKEALQELPKGCTHLVSSGPCPFQMIRYGQNVYATQFHPEASPEEFCERMVFYQHHGYFAPDEVATLQADARAAGVQHAEHVLAAFVARYARP